MSRELKPGDTVPVKCGDIIRVYTVESIKEDGGLVLVNPQDPS